MRIGDETISLPTGFSAGAGAALPLSVAAIASDAAAVAATAQTEALKNSLLLMVSIFAVPCYLLLKSRRQA
jgi:hypothetical protein